MPFVVWEQTSTQLRSWLDEKVVFEFKQREKAASAAGGAGAGAAGTGAAGAGAGGVGTVAAGAGAGAGHAGIVDAHASAASMRRLYSPRVVGPTSYEEYEAGLLAKLCFALKCVESTVSPSMDDMMTISKAAQVVFATFVVCFTRRAC